jgi:hypothetical protein
MECHGCSVILWVGCVHRRQHWDSTTNLYSTNSWACLSPGWSGCGRKRLYTEAAGADHPLMLSCPTLLFREETRVCNHLLRWTASWKWTLTAQSRLELFGSSEEDPVNVACHIGSDEM